MNTWNIEFTGCRGYIRREHFAHFFPGRPRSRLLGKGYVYDSLQYFNVNICTNIQIYYHLFPAKIILEKLELHEMLQQELESFGSNDTSRTTSLSPDIFSHSSNSNTSEDVKLVSSSPILQQNETKEAETPSTAKDDRTKDGQRRVNLERFSFKGLSSKVQHKSDETVVEMDTKTSRNVLSETCEHKGSGEVTQQCKRVRMESNDEKQVTDVETSLHGASNKKAALKLSAFAFGNHVTSRSEGGFSGEEDMVKYSQLAVEDLDFNLSSDDGL